MKPLERVYGKLTALELSPAHQPTRALVLLHGVGSHERNMLELAPILTEDRLAVSLRAPLTLGPNAFGWFHVQFMPAGPVHNWSEAKASFSILEDSLVDLSKKTGISLEKITVLGFSQGAIMTIGLALQSHLDLEGYIASSGRTLPEFADTAKRSPRTAAKARKVFLSHGIQDSKLPIQLGRNSEKILREAGAQLTYKEYLADHGITQDFILDAKKWMNSP